ncbi:unnamed protein product [Rhizopus stolonifer]
MSMLFLAFCGYLINLIYQDQPLIQSSSQSIDSYIETPDIEFCLQNSTMKVIHCSAMYYNWSTVDIDNCWDRFFYAGANDGSASRCWIFETNGEYRMTAGLTYDNRDALRRLDFYWKIDDLYNVTYASISVPAMAIQLYDPKFSLWKPATVGDTAIENMMLTNIRLGATKATTMMNYSSSIYYTPNRYRAIKPGDAAAVVGLTPHYIDIATLRNFQQNWPLLDNPPSPVVNRSLFDGLFSVQLAQSTIDVQTEIRQHTILASLGLAGGCYGVLTSIYVLLFGMTRLTPWGLVHHIPVFISKTRHKNDDKNEVSDDEVNKTPNNVVVPWFFRSNPRKESVDGSGGRGSMGIKETTTKTRSSSDIPLNDRNVMEEYLFSDDSLSDKLVSPVNPLSPGGSPQNSNQTLAKMHKVLDTLKREQVKNDELNSRVQELEVILAEYFIDTSYVDALRGRRKSLDIKTETLKDRRESLPK